MPSKVKRKWVGKAQHHVVILRKDGSRWIPFSSWSQSLAERMAEQLRQLEDCERIEVQCDFYDSDGRASR